MQKFTHGGARPGAGRPKSGEPRKAHSFSCTDAEAEYLKKLLVFIREHNELINKYRTTLVQQQEQSTSFFGIKVSNELHWLSSESARSESLMTKLSHSNKDLQWLESEEELQESTASKASSKDENTARLIAEILFQA